MLFVIQTKTADGIYFEVDQLLHSRDAYLPCRSEKGKEVANKCEIGLKQEFVSFSDYQAEREKDQQAFQKTLDKAQEIHEAECVALAARIREIADGISCLDVRWCDLNGDIRLLCDNCQLKRSCFLLAVEIEGKNTKV